MTRDQRPGAPDTAGSSTGDDGVVPHPSGTGATGEAGHEPPATDAPAREPREPDSPVETAPTGQPVSSAADEPVQDRAAAGEQATAEEQAPAAGHPVAGESGPVAGDPGKPPPAAAPVRRRDPLAAVLIGVLTMLLGFAFAVQVRTVGDDPQLAGAREEDLVRILDELDAQEDRLRDQLAEQRSALEDLTNSDSRAATALEAARQRAEAIGILNGTIAARGPGLEMTIRDPEDEVRVADLLDAIQELRGAGAETMQIDDVRVGVSTAVTGDPGNLMIDGRPITTPYEILVIGDPQNMETAMNIPGGVVQHINNRGGSVEITQSDEVVVDALRPLDTPQYASPRTGD